MNCPNCNKEYFDKNQKICEYCGSDLVIETQKIPESMNEPKYGLNSLLDDLGLKDLRNKIKKKLRELKS
jgi:predicted amidophosphoribosyltransferase